jgi:HSP20 family protein
LTCFLAETGFPIDTVEDKNGLTITADLPGVNKSDISVTHTNNSIYIRATRPCFEGSRQEYKTWLERPCGQMERIIRLPHGIDDASMKATFENGIFTLTAKKIASTSQKIDVL